MSEDANTNQKNSNIDRKDSKDRKDQLVSKDPNSGDISAIIIIDKYKLPEELRNKLPQDLQDKLLELLQEDLQKDTVSRSFQSNTIPTSKPTSKPAPTSENKKSGNLFAMQTGSVVGNIYKDGIFPQEGTNTKIKNR